MLRVLVIGNFSVAPCGIRNAADMTYEGLKRSPLVRYVDKWDATYDLLYARREASLPTYLPNDWDKYDVIHLNWHPIALNTYTPEHFPWPKGEGPLLSVYLNDVPPWSGCPIAERAECLVAPEFYLGTPGQRAPEHRMVYPIPDWVDHLPPPAQEFTVGWSGVRGDGAAEIRGVCEQHGWAMNGAEPPSERTAPWTSIDDEIRRLARSTVNVCWYHAQRGIAGTPSVMLGTRRPLLLNDSKMFAPWWSLRYSDELYTSTLTLERALISIHAAWGEGYGPMLPGPHVYTDHSWTTAARALVNHWLATLEAR